MRDVKPFKVPDPALIDLSPWVRPDLDDQPLPEYLEGWDPETPVVVDRQVRCDLVELRNQCGLNDSVGFVLTVSWINQQSGMVERGYRETLVEEQAVRLHMPGERLGGSILLRTTIAVDSTDIGRPLGTARWAGSVVFQHDQRLVLEGEGAMFPISTMDFAHTAYGPDASWALQITSELESPFLGGFLLLVNSRDVELADAMTSTKRTSRQEALVDQVEGELASLLLEMAIDLGQDLSGNEWPTDSIGELLEGYLQIAKAEKVNVGSGFDRAAGIARSTSAVRSRGFGRRFE